ncbi:hypothetical protein Hanom_Chr16g01462641 [Helianthus anomalus]
MMSVLYDVDKIGLNLPYQVPHMHQNPHLHSHPQYHLPCHHLHHYSFHSPQHELHLHTQLCKTYIFARK